MAEKSQSKTFQASKTRTG